MNTPPPTARGIEPETLLVALLALALGPLALAAASLLALLARPYRRIWLLLAAAPSGAAGFVLWPFVRGQFAAALASAHRTGSGFDVKAVFLMTWPHLWPAWLATTTLAPLIALVIVCKRGRSYEEADQIDGERANRRVARAEARVARKARAADTPEDRLGVFLGYRLAGESLLPDKRGRVSLPFGRLGHHLLVAGATGSGKTETVLRIAYSLARASNWTIVYIDGKGDQETQQRFARLMADAGRRVALFPERGYDGWRGSPEEIANRLLQLVDFADEGGGAYYRDLAVNTVRLACHTPSGPPRSSRELLWRLHQEALLDLHANNPAALCEANGLQPRDLDGIRARYAAFFGTVAGALDGKLSLDDADSVYFLLDGLRLKYEAGYLARFLVEEFTQWAAGRKPREQRVLLIVDEFSALAQAAQGLVDVVERTRGFGVAAILCPQVAEGMGSPEAAARIIGSAQTILLHATPSPELLVQAAGTKRVPFATRQLEGDALTGLGSTRVEHEFRVDPNDVRRLKVGQCFAIGSGLAMKLQIAAAPNLTGANRQPSQPADADLQAR